MVDSLSRSRRRSVLLPQLAIAWCLKNPNVSTVILGASKATQVTENPPPSLVPKSRARSSRKSTRSSIMCQRRTRSGRRGPGATRHD